MKRLLRHHEFYIFAFIVLASVAVSIVNPSFLTLSNLFDLLKSYSFLGILAMGVLTVLVSGGIDISFTAIATVAEYVMAVYITHMPGNMFLAFVIVVCIGISMGAINAVLIYFLRIPTIITTIATLNLFYGALQVFSGGNWIYTLPKWFRGFADFKVLRFVDRTGIPYGLSTETVIWFAVIALTIVVLRFTTLGRRIYAMGGNTLSAKRAGIDIFRTQLFVYCYMGFVSGVAGLVYALTVQTVATNAIVGQELYVIAAVVLGGTTITGGVGTITGTILGVALVGLMSNGLTLMKVSTYWTDFLVGLIILVSVSVSAYRLRSQSRRTANRAR